MMRKLFVVAAAIAIPLGATAIGVATAGVAGAVTPVKLVAGPIPQTSLGAVWAVQPAVAVEGSTGTIVTSGTGSTDVITLVKVSGTGTVTCTGGLTKAAVAGIAHFAGCKVTGGNTSAFVIKFTHTSPLPALTATPNITITQHSAMCLLHGGTVTFASPGLSKAGSFTTASTSATHTTALTLGCTLGTVVATGTSPGHTITTNNTACTALNTPVTGCTAPPPQKYSYDTFASFVSSTGSIVTSIPHITLVIGGHTYTTNTTAASALVCADVLKPKGHELGFLITGTVATGSYQYVGKTAKFGVCLGTDTGTGTSNDFTRDFNGATLTIATTAIDPVSSFATIN